MASSLATTASASASASASAASVTKTTPISSSYLPLCHRHSRHSHSKVSFRLSPKPKLQLFTKGLHSSYNRSSVVRAQLNEVAVDGSSNSAAAPTKSEVPAMEANDAKPSSEPSPAALASEESISEFITQVASLVKLVDSRDIAELQLKQLDCEILIRKKVVLPHPPSSAPVVMMQSPTPPAIAPPAFQAAPPAAAPAHSAPAPPSVPVPAPSPPAAKSSHPPLKCPMAGTFYRCPAPNEPPFVKVGDKVQKGQVLCIIEAMKLMNEIEADQSGTVVEVLAEDKKPVSVDTPLFVIEP
uniref:Biotin carboxyl carrier protein of acetyl-CoA carboxylase n=1 Tax=Davidia involucrata TaxID=16924 RepID=A0A5B7AA72_DAVIN